LLGNIIIFGLAGLATLDSQKLRDQRLAAARQESPPPPASVLISPEMIQRIPADSPAAAAKPTAPARSSAPDFTRTSEDQRGKRPDKPAFIGERDTEATSDRTPDPTAKPLPSQRGEAPRSETDIETTESKYQDGRLDASGEKSAAATPPPQPPAPPTPPDADPAMAPKQAAAPPPPDEKPADPALKPTDEKPSPAVPEPKELLQGPNPVDVAVPKPTPEKVAKTLPPAPPADKSVKAAPDEKPPAPPKPTPKPGDPGVRGNQHKTAIQGSISRTGRSALDVADSPLGRYQAVISRAVEQEWQRNCVRHRDFITPGFLTVRFFVEPSGKVKSVQFVGEMETGEVQKGFTLNSIRNAEIPAMPKELRADFTDESLELIFNFYF
jgi:hypothetical protein